MRRLPISRWLAVGVLLLLVVLACIRLGFWQYERHVARSEGNARLSANVAAPVAPLEELLQTAKSPADLREAEWRRVSATGTYVESEGVASEGAFLLRNRSLDGQPGAHVFVPFRTDPFRTDAVSGTGTTILVNRGWQPAGVPGAATEAATIDVPSGPVELIGHVRLAESIEGRDALGEDDGPPRSVSRIDLGLLDPDGPGIYLQLAEQAPAATGVRALPAAGSGFGANLAYAVQWWLFALLAPVGLVFLLRKERTRA